MDRLYIRDKGKDVSKKIKTSNRTAFLVMKGGILFEGKQKELVFYWERSQAQNSVMFVQRGPFGTGNK